MLNALIYEYKYCLEQNELNCSRKKNQADNKNQSSNNKNRWIYHAMKMKDDNEPKKGNKIRYQIENAMTNKTIAQNE